MSVWRSLYCHAPLLLALRYLRSMWVSSLGKSEHQRSALSPFRHRSRVRSSGSSYSRACVLCMTGLVVVDRSRSPRGAEWSCSVCPSPPTPRGTWWAHNCHNAQLRFALTHGIEELTRAALAKRLWWSIALSNSDSSSEGSPAESALRESGTGSRG